jgi:nucleotide-binding universal stress UspA family protein
MVVLSCWNFEHEDYLRKSMFVRVSEQEIDDLIQKNRKEHTEALRETLQTAGLEKDDYIVEQRRGRPDDIIPAYISENNIDLLLMGTVARTGVPGFVMGNTAEDVIRQTTCSLLTVKPDDFVSPVKF